MKELVKSNKLEAANESIYFLSESSCCDGNVWRQNCNKYCTGGASNTSLDDEGDIIF
ncbi:MAG: hypothetical protein HOO91_09400 [Bacteroidales bacterium]|nr:hypothetical protein [Bacteroidales bacterium]